MVEHCISAKSKRAAVYATRTRTNQRKHELRAAHGSCVQVNFLHNLTTFVTNFVPHVVRSTSPVTNQVILLTRLRVVDNSSLGKQAMLEGRPPKVIHVYTNRKPPVGLVGDKVLMAIKGLKKKGYIVGVAQRQRPMAPRFDSNNVVLVDDADTPIGTRVLVPIPHHLRSNPKMAKVIAITSRFV